ncbi:exopolysaccharide production repressor protein [Mesorhizobium loti]|uniref:exopolysaccharide production repressor protein n=1 Tax=Rhizobium loti TaxID=381 RepID=UPI000683EA48|nr:exopolysaccharide production repressor protein [Mesorhizobium loti]
MSRLDPQWLAAMYFPQFLIGMIATSASVAISAYFKTGSLRIALAWAAASAVLLQMGYFVLLVRLIYQPATSEGTAANKDASGSKVRMPVRLMTLVAIGLLATISLKGTARADDDAYFDCVIGKAEAIMKKQTHRDAEAALERAYALCQPVESSQEAGMSYELPLPDDARSLYPLATL